MFYFLIIKKSTWSLSVGYRSTIRSKAIFVVRTTAWGCQVKSNMKWGGEGEGGLPRKLDAIMQRNYKPVLYFTVVLKYILISSELI